MEVYISYILIWLYRELWRNCLCCNQRAELLNILVFCWLVQEWKSRKSWIKEVEVVKHSIFYTLECSCLPLVDKCKWTKCGFSKRLSSEHWSSVAWLDFPLPHHQSFPLESWNIIFYVTHVGQSYSYWKDISRICGKVQSSYCRNLWWLYFPKDLLHHHTDP